VRLIGSRFFFVLGRISSPNHCGLNIKLIFELKSFKFAYAFVGLMLSQPEFLHAIPLMANCDENKTLIASTLFISPRAISFPSLRCSTIPWTPSGDTNAFVRCFLNFPSQPASLNIPRSHGPVSAAETHPVTTPPFPGRGRAFFTHLESSADTFLDLSADTIFFSRFEARRP